MKSLPNTYLLSPILHKDSYELSDGTILAIDKSFENNLRERNPQLGRVEAVPDNNWLSLEVGDVVAVNHFTFFGDIGEERGFTMKDHVEVDGVLLFPAVERQMFFRYKKGKAEVLPGHLLVEQRIEPIEHFGVYFGDETNWYCTHGIYSGKKILTLSNAPYLITLDRTEYWKVREDEVVWVDGEVVRDCMVVEYLPEAKHVLWGVSKPNNVRVKCISGKLEGEELQVFRNQGVRYGDGWIITDEDQIIGIWKDQKLKDLNSLSLSI